MGSYNEAITCFEKVIEICSKRNSSVQAEKNLGVTNGQLIDDAKQHINKMRN